jgi:molecular chaperone GrpE (heat shock protein)
MTHGDHTTPEHMSESGKDPDRGQVPGESDRLDLGASSPRPGNVTCEPDVGDAAISDDSLQTTAADGADAERIASESTEQAGPPRDASGKSADTTVERTLHEGETSDGQSPRSELVEPRAWESLATSLADLVTRLEESQRLLGRQVDHVDHLHAENQRLRAGELRTAISPLIRDLLRLHDDVGRLVEASTDESKRDLNVVQVSLLDVLVRAGIMSFEPDLDAQFDPKLHNAAGIVATGDAASERRIADVVRTGFHWEDGQILRVADVTVFKYTAPTDEPPHQQPDDINK